jgi:Bacterial Ig-like domain (group 2)
VRTRSLIIAAICGLLTVASGGCSSLLGIEDPTPDFGDGTGTLVSISIKPDPLAIPVGVSQQLTAIGTFDDGSETDVTAQTEFAADSGGPIEVTAAGLARATGEGMAMVTAKIGRISGNTQARGLPAVADHLMFGAASVNIKKGQRVHLRTIAVLTDGRMQDATANAMYESSNSVVATVSAPGQIDGGSQDGMATITASLLGARPASVTVKVSTALCVPVINELQAGSDASAADEWVEIINPCTTPVNVAGWSLVYRGAGVGPTGTDSNLMISLAGTMAPSEIRLYAGADYPGTNATARWTVATGFMGQNNGAVALRTAGLNAGMINDKVAYGAVVAGHLFQEGTALLAMVNGRSEARLPFDGKDDDNGGVDFTQLANSGTPGTTNAPPP